MNRYIRLGIACIVLAFLVLSYHIGSNLDVPVFDNVVEFFELSTSESRSLEFETPVSKQQKKENSLYQYGFSQEQKKAYDTIYKAILNHKETVLIAADLTSGEVFYTADCVIGDHPEFFWVTDNFTYNTSGNLTLKYFYTKEQAAEISKKLEPITQNALSGITSDMDEYEKSVYILNYICKNISYTEDAYDDSKYFIHSNMADTLISKKAMCLGYTKAYQYLLQLAGIETHLTTGKANGGSGEYDYHAWAIQRIDGEYYYTDPTWADSVIRSEITIPQYAYFCMTTKDLEKTHILGETFNYPEFTAMRNNYFVRENLYFEKYDRNAIKNTIKNKIDDEKYQISFKFASAEEYQKAYDNLITNRELTDIVRELRFLGKKVGTEKFAYVEDKDSRVLIFPLNNA